MRINRALFIRVSSREYVTHSDSIDSERGRVKGLLLARNLKLAIICGLIAINCQSGFTSASQLCGEENGSNGQGNGYILDDRPITTAVMAQWGKASWSLTYPASTH
jgi:hypothetical protein